ncbi:Dabb family protein [Clostridium cuniculi]|uniref:Dabb family protein n=1 Tax=Clostridium cuniculi TaxID=2548455 RepID=UPI001056DB54|nr:Dabb family protein [Clostridium cuniculi]
MIKHIILWNFQEGKGSEENKLKIKNGLEELKNKIPGIVEIEVITNPIAGSNAEIILNSTFESVDALNNYQIHEEHVKVARFVKSVTCNRMCMDYEL